MLAQLDQDSGRRARVQEGNPLPLRPDPRPLVDEAEPRGAAAVEHRVEVVDGEADVVDPGPAPGDELADGAAGLGGLEQLPGIGVQRMMADGFGFGAEGDWKAAALVRILKTMADGQKPVNEAWIMFNPAKAVSRYQ